MVYQHQRPAHVPDGGVGWVVTFSSFIVSLLVEGVSFTFGIFFPEFLRYFGESKGKTQMLHSLMFGNFFILGPFASALVNKYGCRIVSGSGAFIVSVGLFLSSFSPNLDVMIFFYSIVGGIGFGLFYLPSIVIISEYFEKRRALATGIAVCGAGVGGFAFAPLCEFLLETYGWKGTLWIMSAILLNGIVVSSSFRSSKIHFNKNVLKTKKSQIENDKIVGAAEKNSNRCCHQICLAMKDMFDFTLLKSPTMMLYGISCFFVMFGFFIPSNFIPVWANDVNLSTDEGALLIVFMGVSSTVTRVVIGFIADKPWANSFIINNIALLIGGISTCFVPFYTTFATLAIYSVVFGFVIATFILLRSILLAELLGIQRLNSSFGLTGLSMGLSTFVGSPIAGALADISGNYDMTFYFAGITLGLGGLICLPLRRISRWERNRNATFNLAKTSEITQKKYRTDMIEPSVYTITVD
ncbi:monocarboxylate transporter 9-like [Ylistrum balloti]|uniref:monocarboxylate transporter 9-like n=1 Tax=Ylistrum balloti TaxID=509963 RepID=UPI002905F418|nr:monocarboxylate transporter 9-like [Ylistrum balloti]